ncbi:MAG: NADPH-dependent glutamate synthase [Candidatus Omnitrophica bacterium]|nr:NADPH-dependent glutamate synthase [Candidatus Omnitrophota bacterium]MDD5774775.1 NADPH-dependent glutamate synthase [Candidatus Omnitrophota bacterium]
MAVDKKSVPMREQTAAERVKNFNEVPLGYNEEEAVKEASRCLQCAKKPCVEGCPVHIDIPAFIRALREKDFQKGIDILHANDSLPCITGRVCPQEEQCQAFCVMKKMGDPISIGRLERFLADRDMKNRVQSRVSHSSAVARKNKKVAVVGSGPAGVTCAAELAKKGYTVTVFEGYHKLGGVLVYGIPEFRLPKAIVETEIRLLEESGVTFVTNALIGRAMTIEELMKDGYAAVFVGAGAGLPNFMGIPGENLNGVYSANEFLTRVNLMKAYLFPEYDTPVKRGRNVAVVGGGNVAMDSARTALRLGADHVYLIYRRSEKEMPARAEEIERAKEEGIDFRLLTNPLRYIGDANGFVKQVECIKMELGAPDASGRRSPVPMTGSEFTIDIDEAIVAIGNTPNPIIPRTTPGLKIKKRGEIEADEDGRTSIPGVFAGGDIVTGAATVITAMGAGRKSAQAIDDYLTAQK